MKTIHLAARSIAFVTLLPLTASAQTASLISVSTNGVQGNALCAGPRMSADGAFVAFVSNSTTLVPNDTNGKMDVFVRDVANAVTTRVSVDSAGIQGNGISPWVDISGDGRFVVFSSLSTNLVPGDTNGFADVFMHDRQLATTQRLSVSSAGIQGDSLSGAPVISADGRIVAFTSYAANLVPGDTNSTSDIFVRDTLTGVTTRVSVDSSGIQANGICIAPSLSANGRYVAFQSAATDLVPNDFNGTNDAFVYDRVSATMQLVSVPALVLGSGDSGSPVICGDGHLVVFSSTASNLVPGDTNVAVDIFVRNLFLGTTQRINLRSDGSQTNGMSFEPSISADGRFVAYTSLDPILPGAGTQVYRYDLQTGAVIRAGTKTGGLPGLAVRGQGVLSADGSKVAFVSDGDDMVPGDQNNQSDVILTDLAGAPYVQYCFGDGTGTACPCGNNSIPGQMSGCVNSTGTAGSLIASGTPSISADSLVLIGTGMPVGAPCLYYQGTEMQTFGSGDAFGDGLRCVGGTIVRLGVVFNTASGSTYPVGALSISIAGGCTVGATNTYQGWYRDAASFCAPETFNLTNGLALSWRP
jgi:Tol biopolymer transport system component